MTLVERAMEFMVTFPRPSMYGSGLPDWKDGSDEWHGMCAQFCWRLADWLGWQPEPEPPYGTAIEVAIRSGSLEADPGAAPIGAWHFWSGGDGHVAFDCTGAGAVCAEGYRNVNWFIGENCGFDNVESITRKLGASAGMEYIGWSTNYAGGGISLAGFAALRAMAFPEEIPEPESEALMAKTIVMCTDIARVGGVSEDTEAWVIYGPPASTFDSAIRVTHDENTRNRILKCRGVDISDEDARNKACPLVTFDELATALDFEVGCPPMQLTAPGQPPGWLMVDGFRWGSR